MMQDEAEQNRLDKVHAQNQMKQMMQNFVEERMFLKSELVANQQIMQEMTAQIKSRQNQPKPNVSLSMDVPMSSAPQWFDMEAPGG
eukprot:3423759-Karenia_brevis.AAC.1